MPRHQHHEPLTVRVVVEAIAYEQCPPTQRLAWDLLWGRLLAPRQPPAAAPAPGCRDQDGRPVEERSARQYTHE